jgi:hypothetical protein
VDAKGSIGGYMPLRIELPRLSRSDMEEMAKAHAAIVRAVQLLDESKWQGAGAVAFLVGIADGLIARLYNKAEASVIRQSGLSAAETAPGAPLEEHPADEAGRERYGASAKPVA